MLVGLGLFALVILVYWPGLSGGFLLDDYPQIVHHEAVHMESVDADSVRAALEGFRHGVGRPLPMLSFALDYRTWGLEPWGYKLSSVLVHAFNSVLVYALLLRLLALPLAAPPRHGRWAALLLATAWALHPLQVSTVLYVVQRMETLSLLFVLSALLAYLSARQRQIRGEPALPWLLASVVLGMLGLACKESAALLPLYTLALELTVLRFAAKAATTVRIWQATYALLLLAGLAAAALLAPAWTDPATYAIRDYTALERVLTQARVLPMYLGWVLVPDPGSYLFYYDAFAPSRGLLSPPTTLAGSLLLLALAAGAVLARRQLALFSLGVAWFFAAHALTSSFIPLELVFEHRNYFAVLGLVVAAFDLVRRLLAGRVSTRLAGSLGILVVAGLVFLTTLRTATWGEPLHLALELAQKNPLSVRAGTGLGDQYLLMADRRTDDPFVSLAEAEYERVAVLPHASPIADQALVLMAAQQGLPADPAWWDRLVQKLASRPIGPEEMTVVTSLLDLRNRGLAIDDRRLAEAYTILARRMSLPPTQYFAFALHALSDLKDEALAREMLQLTVEHSDGNQALLDELSAHLRETGQPAWADFLETTARR